MKQMNAANAAQKWASNLARSTQSITDGVNAVTVAPAQAAIAAIPRYLQGVQDAVSSGKMARGLGRVTLASWQDAMRTKGIPRIQSGASAAVPKMQAYFTAVIPHLAALQTKLAAMPRGDRQTNIQRAVTSMNHMADFVYNK